MRSGTHEDGERARPARAPEGLAREPDPDPVEDPGPAACRSCKAALDGTAATGSTVGQDQVVDIEVNPRRRFWSSGSPALKLPCSRTVRVQPPGARGSCPYGRAERRRSRVDRVREHAAQRPRQVMAMLLGVPVSPGWVDKASARLAAQLGKAGFDAAMLAALAGQDALAADETPVNVLDKNAPQPAAREEGEEQDPEDKEKAAAGAPHVLIVRTPDGRLTWLQALASRRKGDVAAGIPAAFTGLLMTDGYTGYQHLLTRLRRHPAVLPAHNQAMPGSHETRPRRPAGPRQATSSPSCARRTRPSKTPAPAAAPPSARTC